MNPTINFFSVVALGNFNPAIATPEFLNDVCELNLGTPTDESPAFNPVLKRMKFNNITFTVTLDRLAIKETGIDEIGETSFIKIFKTYINMLPYTPLRVAGININADFEFESDEVVNQASTYVSNPNEILNWFKVKEIAVEEKYFQTGSDKEWLSSNFIIKQVESFSRQILIEKKADSLTVNYNSEANELINDKSRLDLFILSHSKFYDEFKGFVKYWEENI